MPVLGKTALYVFVPVNRLQPVLPFAALPESGLINYKIRDLCKIFIFGTIV